MVSHAEDSTVHNQWFVNLKSQIKKQKSKSPVVDTLLLKTLWHMQEHPIYLMFCHDRSTER
jgi:hypothetical protein